MSSLLLFNLLIQITAIFLPIYIFMLGYSRNVKMSILKNSVTKKLQINDLILVVNLQLFLLDRRENKNVES